MKAVTVAARCILVILCLSSSSEASSALDLLRDTAGESFDSFIHSSEFDLGHLFLKIFLCFENVKGKFFMFGQ